MGSNHARDVVGELLAADVDEDVIRVLRSRERRYVLYYLLDRERASLEELADVLAGWLAATDSRVVERPERESLRIALYHTHLPALADAGLVEFDPEARAVRRSSLAEDVRDVVRAAYLADHRTEDPST